MSRMHTIARIPGDGIGQELVPGVADLIDAVLAEHGSSVSWVDLDWGCDRYVEGGTFMPPDWAEILDRTDAIFLGAVGSPSVPDHVSLWNLLLPIRRELRQSLNVRPIVSLPGIPTPLRSSTPFDVLIVRENNEGEYTSVGGSVYTDTPDEVVVQSAIFTRHGIERVARYAFEQASTRRSEVVSATKSNGLPFSMPFWDHVVADVASEFPDVRCRSMHIDALAARLVQAPEEFDVIVASNLFGDILSDEAAMITGSIGMLPSASLSDPGGGPGLFEPVHGSAPDIAGQGIANPLAMFLSAAMLLRHGLGLEAEAQAVESAVDLALQAGLRTRDLGGQATTQEATRAVLAHL